MTQSTQPGGEATPASNGSGSGVLSQIGAVVLNYNDYQSSIECVRSLLQCDPLPMEIVVVDNHSPNGSYEILRRELGEIDRVSVIDSGRNGGYSFGNNVGIRRLRSRGVKHVVIATSDTKVLTPNLFARLLTEINENTGAIAPQISSPGGVQNPSVERLSLKYIVDLWWVQHGMPGLRIRRWLRRRLIPVPRRKSEPPAPIQNDTITTPNARIVYKLHGAFICLAAAFLDRFDGLDERIFLFGEEDLLAWQCWQSGLQQCLIEDILVHHEEDSSVEMTLGQNASEFVDQEQRRSARVLKETVSVARLAVGWIRSGT